jgi:hypothetical protein
LLPTCPLTGKTCPAKVCENTLPETTPADEMVTLNVPISAPEYEPVYVPAKLAVVAGVVVVPVGVVGVTVGVVGVTVGTVGLTVGVVEVTVGVVGVTVGVVGVTVGIVGETVGVVDVTLGTVVGGNCVKLVAGPVNTMQSS